MSAINISDNTTDNTSILVIGDVMLDKYWFTSSSELAKDAPVAAVNVNSEEYRAGGAANVALNVQQLSGKDTHVGILAPIGLDSDGERLSSILEKYDIKDYLIKNENNQTITKHRIISNKQQLVRVDFEQKYQAIELSDEIKKIITKFNIIVLSDYNKNSLKNCQEIINFAKANNKIIIADPKGNDFSKYQLASLITPNYKEFTDIVGECNTSDILDHKANNLLNTLMLDYLLVTLGSKGMNLYTKDKKYHAKAYAEEVFDVTGAGDTVLAAIAVSLSENKSIEDAIEFASNAAALAVNQIGTGFVTRQSVNDFIAKKNKDTSSNLNFGTDNVKMINIVNPDDYNKLIKKHENDSDYYIWDYVNNNILTAKNIKKLNDYYKQSSNKLTVIIDNDQSEKSYHTVQELAYMLSLLSAVDTVYYREYV